MQDWNHPVKTTSATQCGPLMVRYIIDGREVMLPCDAKLHPRITTAEELERELVSPLGGTY